METKEKTKVVIEIRNIGTAEEPHAALKQTGAVGILLLEEVQQIVADWIHAMKKSHITMPKSPEPVEAEAPSEEIEK